MIDLSVSAAIATGGAVLCMVLKAIFTGASAYDIGFEDGKRYMTEILLGECIGRDSEGEEV